MLLHLAFYSTKLYSMPNVIAPNLINVLFQAKSDYMSQLLGWVREAEMEKKDNLFNYLNAKLIEIIYTTS